MFLISTGELILGFIFVAENVQVVIGCNCSDFLHAFSTRSNFLSVEYFVKGVLLWEIGIYKIKERLSFSRCNTVTV